MGNFTVRKLKFGGLLAMAGLLASLLVAGPAAAVDPGYYLLTPYSSPGQLAVDVRYWTVKPPNGRATLWPEVGLRYGFSDRWTSEVLASYVGGSLDEQKLYSLNWQNTYLLTQGQYPFDLGVFTQLIHEFGEGNAVEVGPVFQTELGTLQLNFNLLFAHSFASTEGTQLKYQWQALQRLQRGVRLGLQGFGELGRWNAWSDRQLQSHRAGPVLRLNLMDKMELQAAYLFGRTYGRQAGMFSAQMLVPF
ncbi:hypothetical protein BH11PSE11_BH11PSE11_04890 [soil metagenome]